MEKKNKNKPKMNKKIWILVIIVLSLAVCVALTIMKLTRIDSVSEIYELLTGAMETTESNGEFVAQITSKSQFSMGDEVQVTTTRGYISSNDDPDDVYVYLNTVSETPANPEKDHDVTVSMFTDGEKVYDDTSGTNVEIDMTVEEFNSIIDEYGLYRYDEKDVDRVEYDENELSDFSGSGTVTVFLTTPGEDILEGYANAIAFATGESVGTEELKVNSAFVTYTLFEEAVSAQTCTFAVEYKSESGETVYYSVTNQVAYIDDYEREEDAAVTKNGEVV